VFHSITTNEFFNDKNKIKINININLGVKLYFHVFIASCNYSRAFEKKTTQLISEGVFIFSHSLYSVIIV
jgi:hypothetical protein